MNKKLKLTPAEWEIMEAVWELGAAPSVRDVMEYRYPDREKAYTTIMTIMNTLEKKGFLKRKKIGLVNFYKPAKTRSQIVKSEISSLTSRIFKGSTPAFANFLINNQSLSLQDIEAIKQELSKKENEMKDRKDDRNH